VKLTRDRQASEDVLHEAYTRLAREVAAGRSPQNTRAWLYQVARNIVTSGGRRQQVADRWRQRQRVDGAGASAEDQFLLREARVELQAAMLDLNATDRLALRMAAEGFSGAEIAAMIGRSSGAVRARLCRARGRLRTRLHDAAAPPAPQGASSAGSEWSQMYHLRVTADGRKRHPPNIWTEWR